MVKNTYVKVYLCPLIPKDVILFVVAGKLILYEYLTVTIVSQKY